MNIWIHRDGRQLGPFPIDKFDELNITPDTPVWYEGLSGWIPAGESDVLRPLLQNQAENARVNVEVEGTPVEEVDVETTAGPISDSQQTAYGNRYDSSNQPAADRKCPPTCMFWSIFTTLCCCMPLGIISIFYSAKVRRKFQEGNYEAAVKASDTTQWLVIIGLTVGLILTPITLLMNNWLS